MNINSNRYSSANYSSSTYNCSSNYSTLSSLNELTTIEAENIYQFSDLLDRIQQNGGDLMRDRQVQVRFLKLCY